MASKSVTVGSVVGLHARPAALIAAAASEYDDDITISLNGSTVDAGSSLLIMTLGAERGAVVTVESDNAEAVERIAGMVSASLHGILCLYYTQAENEVKLRLDFLKKSLDNTPQGYIMHIERQGRPLDEEKMCCCCKKTERSEEERRALMNRLSRIEGQIRGIRGMLERDAYCADILTQSAAVSAAMNGFNRALLNAHLHNCVVRDIRAGDDSVVDELTELLQKLMK